MPKTQTNSRHEIENFLSVQARLASLRYGMQVKANGPLIEELEKLSGLPCVSFPLKAASNDPGEVNISIANKEAGTLAKPDVDLILEKSTPSAFGRGEKTVMDEEYRSGREIVGADIQLAPEDRRGWVSEQFLSTIEWTVASAMFAGRKVVLKLYKLAVYKEGGHFDWHMDSTHSDRHHATVLLALNTSWVGGDLLLRRNGVETRVDLKPKANKKGSKTLLQAVAFYTDTEHKVEPVTQGIRIVLQYDVEVDGWSKENNRKHGREDENENENDENEDEDEDEDEDSEEEEYMFEEDSQLQRVEATYLERRSFRKAAPIGGDPAIIKNIMDLIQKMLKSGVEELGFATQYLYRTSSILPEFLKGADAVLYQALVATFDVSLRTVVLKESSDYEGGYHGEDSACYAYRFDDVGSSADPQDDTMEGSESSSASSSSEDESDESHPTPSHGKSSTIFYVPNVSAIKEISSESYIEHTGNEAQLGEHKYFGGGMFVRRRKIV